MKTRILAVLAMILFALTPVVIAQQIPAGSLYATNFTNWQIPKGNNAPFTWSNPQACTTNSDGLTFKAFYPGTPVLLVDLVNPSLTEAITPTAVSITGAGCTLTVTPTHSHVSFYLTTSTGGLQEAINYSRTAPAVVVITADWTGITSQIASAVGNTDVSVLDARTSVILPYIWNSGSSLYVAQPFASGGAVVKSLNTLVGDLTLAQGSNITITPSGGNTLTIAATVPASGVTTATGTSPITVNGDSSPHSGAVTIAFPTDFTFSDDGSDAIATTDGNTLDLTNGSAGITTKYISGNSLIIDAQGGTLNIVNSGNGVFAQNVDLQASQLTGLADATTAHMAVAFDQRASTKAAVTHDFLTAYTEGTPGTFTAAQPAFTDISGNIAVTQMNSGTGATSSTFWRGDGTWVTPTGFANPMTLLGDIIRGGTGGAATRLAGPTSGTDNYFLLSNPSGGSATAPAWFDATLNIPFLGSVNTFINANHIGTGGTLDATGSGTISATNVGGVALSGLCQTAGTNCPTSIATATNLAGGALGSLLYQNAANTTLFLAGNAIAQDQVLVSRGMLGGAQAPTLSNAPALSAANMTSIPAVTSIATTGPIGGGTITTTGTITCATCLTGSTPAAHGVMFGAGTQALSNSTAGAAGTLLFGQGAAADPSFAAMSGDSTINGSGVLTLATVNSGPGACGDATHVCAVTTNGKGLVTAQTATAITGVPASSVAFSGLTGSTNTTAAMVVGSGATLGPTGSGTITATAMPATGLTGTIADARLSANVPLLNAANTFTNASPILLNNSSSLGLLMLQAGTAPNQGYMGTFSGGGIDQIGYSINRNFASGVYNNSGKTSMTLALTSASGDSTFYFTGTNTNGSGSIATILSGDGGGKVNVGSVTAAATMPGLFNIGCTTASACPWSVTSAGATTLPSIAINGGTAITAQTGTGGTAVMSVSPALTGTPTVPTASPGTGNTQAASTAYADASSAAASYLTALGGSLTCTNVTLGAGAGSGASCTSITGLDGIHHLSITTGTLPTLNATIATVTFTTSRGHTTWPVLSPADNGTAQLTGMLAPTIFGGSATSYVITAGLTALPATSLYSWNISAP